MKIAVFYHCLFCIGTSPAWSAVKVVHEQMKILKDSGLEDAASEIHIGVNGSKESEIYVTQLMPKKAKVAYHGLQCRNELRTVLMMQEWCKESEEDAACLYFHSKGATHAVGSAYGENNSKPWRLGMMEDLVTNWRTCVLALSAGNDVVCSHWMWNMADGTQHIPAGNFLWVKSSFVRKLPSMFLRDRLKLSGIDSVESRFEAEVFWGNGPRPTVKQFRPNGGGGVP